METIVVVYVCHFFRGIMLGSRASVREAALLSAACVVVAGLCYVGLLFAGSTGNSLADGLRVVYGCIVPALAFVVPLWLSVAVMRLMERN